MTQRSALLIINPKSRLGSSDLADGIARLQNRNFALRVVYTSDPQRIPDLIEHHSYAVDTIILGGGDGTLNCALDSLVKRDLAVGILPLGTANDLARTLDIPTSVIEACEVVASGQTHPIDVGSVNGHFFLNAANIGLGAKVTRQLSCEDKSRWGIFAYARSMIAALRAHNAFRAHVTCDGISQQLHTMHITVGNGCFYGGGMSVADEAAIDDKRLDLFSVKPQGFWRLVGLGPALRSGNMQEKGAIFQCRGKKIEIVTDKPMQVTADGEFKSLTPAVFRVVPGALKIIIPDQELRTPLEGILRDPVVIGLDQVKLQCEAIVRQYKDLLADIGDAPLAAVLEQSASAKARYARRLNKIIRDIGELPSALDPEQQWLSNAVQKVELVFSDNERQQFLNQRDESESALIDRVDETSELTLPDQARALLNDLRNSTIETRMRFRSLKQP